MTREEFLRAMRIVRADHDDVEKKKYWIRMVEPHDAEVARCWPPSFIKPF